MSRSLEQGRSSRGNSRTSRCVSDEHWTVSFVPRMNAGRMAEIQLPLLPHEPEKVGRVLLHSGGLDSIAGIATSLQSVWPGQMLLATVKTHPRTFQAAERTVAEIQSKLGGHRIASCLPLVIDISRSGRCKDDRESTQRTRSLLYLAYGIALASMVGLGKLHVFENGIGAINLPMTSDHLGYRASRAMHPRTLSLMSKLSSLVLGCTFSIQNLGLWMTKGEARRPLSTDRMHRLFPMPLLAIARCTCRLVLPAASARHACCAKLGLQRREQVQLHSRRYVTKLTRAGQMRTRNSSTNRHYWRCVTRRGSYATCRSCGLLPGNGRRVPRDL